MESESKNNEVTPKSDNILDPTIFGKEKKHKHPRTAILLLILVLSLLVILTLALIDSTIVNMSDLLVFYLRGGKVVNPVINVVPNTVNITGDAKLNSKTGNQDSSCESLKKYENKTDLNIIGREVVKDENEKIILNLISTRTMDLPDGQQGKIVAFDIDSKNNKIAYILGVDPIDKNEYIFENRVVYISDLLDGSTTKVYETEDILGESPDRSDGLTAIGFSDDGDVLAVTTFDRIYSYNISDKDLSLLHEYTTGRSGPGYSAYTNPVFSPDNNYLLITEGHYEGFTDMVFDINKEEFLDITFGGYVLGTDAVGWYGNRLIVHEYGEFDTGNFTEDSKAYFIDPQNPFEKESVWESKDGGNQSLYISGDHLYYSYETSKTGGEYACNNIKMKYEITSQFSNLSRLNLKTGEDKKILTIDSTESSGVDAPNYELFVYGSYYLKGVEQLLMEIRHDGKEPIYRVGKSEPYGVIELVI
ncbi:hypothetical protein A2V49_00700 [candidate division WWE3 bacterium RBG_19FT_COMBO_34_6]|uniref:Uncharacterized protein n=1 Tax=candidate division WWE3 bacterium RBG_19FT_COMBO_34_6 TaxID=1802612 RepID=A0A1F4UMC9_UNCKA|nr:MAG: hypothetical protein A2V49_00700 [candidate division WWE3 bacterium RBG_19FT_COMBO_34_6]